MTYFLLPFFCQNGFECVWLRQVSNTSSSSLRQEVAPTPSCCIELMTVLEPRVPGKVKASEVQREATGGTTGGGVGRGGGGVP